ncbi:MAG: TolC family protein [Salinivirgaceae bacterium]|jgi:outer membrane protein TolC|nr:TolC family protein [Salinivirgaceae bacterium]
MIIRSLPIALFIYLTLTFLPHRAAAQTQYLLSLEDVVQMAKQQSPRAIMAKHTYKASYWSFRSYKANYLPSLSLNATPFDMNRSYQSITLDDGTDSFVERSSFSNSGSLEINQRIAPTGGDLYLSSTLERVELLSGDETTTYLIAPVKIGYRQPLVTFNAYRWDRKTEPLRYRESERQYLSTMEEIARTAVSYFFDLALAQINKEISESNFYNNDTLYKIAQGRYNMGTIAKDELLQMELSFLRSRKAFNEADLNRKVARFRLKSFLGITPNAPIKLIVPNKTPQITINVDTALHYAMKQNPEMLKLERERIEADRNVAKARAENLFNANLNATLGLNKYSKNMDNPLSDLENSQMISVGISVPILDWGVGKGKYEMAKSERELSLITIEQNRVDFEQEIFLEVARFNMQDEQLLIAAKSDTIAQIRYEITKQRFKVGKVSILDLNTALSEKDVARRDYVAAMRNYWNNYYNIRGYTLYDFLQKKRLTTDYRDLIEN